MRCKCSLLGNSLVISPLLSMLSYPQLWKSIKGQRIVIWSVKVHHLHMKILLLLIQNWELGVIHVCCGLNSIDVVSDQGEDPSFAPANSVGSKALVSSDFKGCFGCRCVSWMQHIVMLFSWRTCCRYVCLLRTHSAFQCITLM